jgi:hypothetical protein
MCMYFVPPPNVDTTISELKLEFLGGNFEYVKLNNGKDVQKICFVNPAISNYVKVIITKKEAKCVKVAFNFDVYACDTV